MSSEHLEAIREAMENHWTGDDEGHVVVMAHAEEMANHNGELWRENQIINRAWMIANDRLANAGLPIVTYDDVPEGDDDADDR